jgi:uncharacterized membrane protein YagU involved in acid resistance
MTRGIMRVQSDSKNKRANGSIVADIVKGAVAGAVGVWLMDRVTWEMYRSEDREAYRQEKAAQVDGMYASHVAADRAAEAVGVDLSGKQLDVAGQVVHYATGIVPGALYGALRNRVDGVGAGRGLLYGLGLFAIVDEGAVPLLGLGSGPTAYPWQAHARGLVGHLVLGAITDTVIDVLDEVA